MPFRVLVPCPRHGFTLIELLVVIAIIGILASVVLGSLNSARDKGGDGAIKSNISGMRAQAELYFDANSLSYGNLCTDPNIVNASESVNNAAGVFECESSNTEFRISSILTTGEYFCTDNNGFANEVTTAPTGTQCN